MRGRLSNFTLKLVRPGQHDGVTVARNLLALETADGLARIISPIEFHGLPATTSTTSSRTCGP